MSMELKRINSKKEAIEAFIDAYGSLARALNPCAPSYDGYDFVKYRISIKGCEPFVAYVAHNEDCNTSFVVPVDGSEPSIQDFDHIEIIRKVNTPKQAVDAFMLEFGSLARALNPCAPAYDGYRFEKKKISYNGDTFKAFIASDTAKKTMFIVPCGGSTPEIADFDDVKIIEKKK